MTANFLSFEMKLVISGPLTVGSPQLSSPPPPVPPFGTQPTHLPNTSNSFQQLHSQFTMYVGELNPPITLFVFADFVSEHYETVLSWAQHFEIASRGERYFLPGVFAKLRPNLRRKSILHARKIFETYGLDTASYLAQLENGQCFLDATSHLYKTH